MDSPKSQKSHTRAEAAGSSSAAGEIYIPQTPEQKLRRFRDYYYGIFPAPVEYHNGTIQQRRRSDFENKEE